MGGFEAFEGELGGAFDSEGDPKRCGAYSVCCVLTKQALQPTFLNMDHLIVLLVVYFWSHHGRLTFVAAAVQDAEKALEYGVNGIVVSNHGELQTPFAGHRPFMGISDRNSLLSSILFAPHEPRG